MFSLHTVGARVRKARVDAGMGVLDLRQCSDAWLVTSLEDLDALEKGLSPAERWGALLGKISLETGARCAYLVSPTGRFKGITSAHSIGAAVREAREDSSLSRMEMSLLLGVSMTQYEDIERDESGLQEWGPRLLALSDALQLPLFDLVAMVPVMPSDEPPTP